MHLQVGYLHGVINKSGTWSVGTIFSLLTWKIILNKHRNFRVLIYSIQVMKCNCLALCFLCSISIIFILVFFTLCVVFDFHGKSLKTAKAKQTLLKSSGWSSSRWYVFSIELGRVRTKGAPLPMAPAFREFVSSLGRWDRNKYGS